ncbi:MAG: hypothetical protein A3F68_04335 [Acidobacteria bacterium RIFCSPLOWO2_12_FULL_54_10]|nr:MAG: hypothetical protein A3F68_04335 [Acidobacteria bacterium RIFCSPLOWO2_12_FULL_54_10]
MKLWVRSHNFHRDFCLLFFAFTLAFLRFSIFPAPLFAADEAQQILLRQVRDQVKSLVPPKEPVGPRLQLADDAFFLLLAAQGEEAAARQSLDRISGWSKASELRLEAQQIAPLDREMLLFAEAKASARLSLAEADRRRAQAQIAQAVGKPATTLYLAVMRRDQDSPAESQSQPAPGNASSVSDLAARLEKELLPQAHELLGKIYQSYLFGGVSLTDLLWIEEEVFGTELQYQKILVQVDKESNPPDPVPPPVKK